MSVGTWVRRELRSSLRSESVLGLGSQIGVGSRVLRLESGLGFGSSELGSSPESMLGNKSRAGVKIKSLCGVCVGSRVPNWGWFLSLRSRVEVGSWIFRVGVESRVDVRK